MRFMFWLIRYYLVKIKGVWCLTPLSIIFGGQFYWWRKRENPEKTTNLPQVTDKLSHNVEKNKDNHLNYMIQKW